MGKAKTIFSGMAWTTIQNIVNIIYGFIAIPILINFYGKEQYGLIGLAISVNAYMTLLDMGMTNSNVRFFSEFLAKGDKSKVQRLFGLTHLIYLVLGLLNSVVLIIASLFVDSFFNVTPEQAVTLRNLLWILALNATFSWISICYDQFLRAYELIDWIKKRSTFLKLMLFGVLICAVTFKWPIEWYFVGFTFMGTIILPLTIVKARRLSPDLKFNFSFDKELFLIILPYTLSLFSFGIFSFLVNSSRPLFLGNMIGPGAVADFNIISAISGVVTVFTTSIIQVLLPVLTKMQVNEDKEGIQSIMQKGTKYITLFLTGLIFVMSISSKELLTVYVGDQFVSLTPWLVLSCITFLLSHRNVMTALVFTERKLSSVSIMCAFAMVVAFACFVIFIPVYGVGGVVIGYAAHEVIHTLFYYVYFLPKRFSINTGKIFFKSVLPSWLLLGVAALAVYFAFIGMDGQWLPMIVKSIVYGLLYLVIVWFVLLDRNDKSFLLSFIYFKNNKS